MQYKTLDILLVLVMAVGIAQGAIVYTAGSSDGVGCCQAWLGGEDTWVTTGGEIMNGYYYFYGGPDWIRSYPAMQFPLGEFVGMTNVIARLGFYVTGGEGIGGGYVRFYDGDGHGMITYDHGAYGSIVAGGNLTGAGWQSIDVSAQVQAALDKGYDWVTFNINMPDYDMSVSIVASENTETIFESLKPQLSVTPEPMTLGYVGVGGLVLVRRRSR